MSPFGTRSQESSNGSRDLCIALSSLDEGFGWTTATRIVQPFGHPFSNNLDTIRPVEFEITIHQQRSIIQTYDVLLHPDSSP